MRRVRSYRRRGFGYIAVLGITMIVTVVGLSALSTMRIELHATSGSEDAVKARFGASSSVELGMGVLAAVPNWRSVYLNDTWTPGAKIDDVTYSFKLVDEQDGNLANDESQPVRLYGKATVGDAVRIYSVLLANNKSGIIDNRVVSAEDDAEERSSDGKVWRYSSDLEIPNDAFWPLTDVVGVRFRKLAIPQGASIQSAYVQFQVDAGVNSGTALLAIRGENADRAAKFGSSNYDLTTRITTAAVAWSPPAWGTVGAAGVDQRTPDLSALIQQIVGRAGWSSGNAIVIIISGTGTRSAVAYDGNPTGAASLHVELAGADGGMIPQSGSWRREVVSP